MEPILIVSGVLGSICAVLLILLLYLIRVVRRKNQPRKGWHYPPGIIVQDHIPEFMPGTKPHRVQSTVSSPPPITAEQWDTRNYGPDMSRFFGHRIDEEVPSSISLEYLNTPVGSPAIKIKHRTGHKGRSCPSSPTSPFNRRKRGYSEPPSPKWKKKRSATTSSTSEVIGKLEFSYYFDEKNRQLHVNVIQALRLPGDENLESYVIAMLKPDEMNWRRETKFVFNSTDPLFNETFLVSGFTHTKIRECSLQFLIMNNAENKAVGQLHVSLADLQPNKITSRCLSLSPMVSEELNDSEFSERPPLGEMLMSLCHNPSEGKLTITIKSAKGLPGVTKSGKIDPYVKIRVFFCGERIYKKKTTIKHDTKTPNYEESFDFVVTRDKMPQTSVILRLYHHGRRVNVLSKNILIGVVFLGYQFELFGPHPFLLDHGARHWASIIEKPHLTIEEWHPIQAFTTS